LTRPVHLLARSVAIIAPLVVLNFTTVVVLRANLARPVYPTAADSIAIPIASTFVLSLIACTWLMAHSCLVWLVNRFRHRLQRGWYGAIAMLLAFGDALPAAIYGLHCWVWLDADHVPISLSWAACAFVLLWLSWRDAESFGQR
jgi:hypothetical protein